MRAPVPVLLLLGLVAAPVAAYLPDWGPFFPFERVETADLPQCALAERLGEPGIVGPPIHRYAPPAPGGPVLELVAAAREEDGVHLRLLGPDGDELVPRVRVSDALGSFLPERVVCARLDEDAEPDFLAEVTYAGNGLGACRFDRVAVLSGSGAYRAWIIPTMCPGPEDLVRFGGRRRPLLVRTTYVSNRTLDPDREAAWHSYWVYDLLAFERGEVRLANDADPRFPKWVWWTFRPNHRPVRSLSSGEKAAILAAEGVEPFREARE